ncbi:MAG: AAA family ATPase [Thermodesulfovibrionales bacterium]|nr:AAA family ATPase [Thermodesulfovibrionales bacterium]
MQTAFCYHKPLSRAIKMAFKDIIGHEIQIDILKGFIKKGRIPSCLIFSGDSGIGKSAVALNYAKLLTCGDVTDNDCCNVCVSCKKMDTFVHPDLLYIDDSETEIKVDNIRKLEDFVFVRPYEATKKVVIIDEAHRMNQSAQNAFLKTLEEPPDYCYFILVSSAPDLLFETVRSRCVHIRFKPLPIFLYETVIKAKKSSIERSIFSICMGRPGYYLSGKVKDDLEGFFSCLADMKGGEIKEKWGSNDEMAEWLEIFMIHLRDMLVSEITRSQAHCIISNEKKGLEAKRILELYNETLNLYQKVDMNLNKKIVWNYVREMIREKV